MSDFLKSLKPRDLEEYVDFIFYRRLAHPLVQVLAKTSITPNQVTTGSLILGLTASWAVYRQFFLLAFVFAVSAIVLDCCDGQLARITGKANPIGHMMDGLFDFLWITAFWLAIHFSGYFQSQDLNVFWLMIAAAASMIVHCWKFDGTRVRYIELANPVLASKEMDMQQIMAFFHEKRKNWELFAAFLSLCLAFQVYFFVRGKETKLKIVISPERAKKNETILSPVIRRFTWLGEGTHNTLVLIGVLLATWTPYGLITAFWIILVPMNMWFIFNLWNFNRLVKQLKTT